MVNFGKYLKQRKSDRPTDPLEIYERLDRLSDTGPLRPAQEYVLKEWHEKRRAERDLIVKLHTGQGKTVVGLLMLQSRLHEGCGPALYLCPNKFLVDQTCFQAQRFGINVTNANVVEDLPTDFLDGDKIYVCTIQKLFNGLTKFGLKGNSLPLGTLLMDDSHGCIDSIRQACSFVLKAEAKAYEALLQLFIPDLREQGVGTLADVEGGDHDALLPVPYWAWIDRRDEVTEILAKYRNDDDIRFGWPVLRDMLDKCCCVFSGSGLEISPYIAPLHQFGSYFNAKHRVFMSATVTDDSFLVKGLRLSADTITNPVTYPREKWFGEKMILIPTLIDGDTGREQVIGQFGKPTKKRPYGVVGLCASGKAAELWRTTGAAIAESDTMSDSIQRLFDGQFDDALCVVNRYDGIDLPDKTCRILILDSKPFSGGLLDRYNESCRPGSDVTAQRTARVIEQGIGRGVRGEKDFCAVVLIGGDLVRAVQRSDVKKFYSSQTRKQIEIGTEIANMSEDDVKHGVPGIDITLDCVKKLLNRDSEWKEFYADRMNGVTLDKPNKEMLKLYEVELEAETKLEQGKPLDARKVLQRMLDGSPDMPDEDRGWYAQEMARLMYRQSKAESSQLQAAAHKLNGYLLKPQGVAVFKKLEPLSQKRVANIIEWVQKSKDFQDLMIRVLAFTGDLRFGAAADSFEQAFDELGRALGFAAERPEKVWKQGPDNLWCFKKNQYLLVECKNEVKDQREEITKSETGQLNNSFAWFSENYPGAESACVMVIPVRRLGAAAGFNMPVTIMRETTLKKLRRNVQNFFQEFGAADLADLEPSTVQKWIVQHHLDTDEFVRTYTESVQS